MTTKQRVNYIITDSSISVNYEGQTHIVPRTDALTDKLIEAIKARNYEAIPELVSVAKRVETFGQGDFTVEDGQVLVKGQVVPDVLGRKIIRFSNEGLPHEPLVRFAENLLQNPSFRAVNELYSFLEKNDQPITDEGFFVAYKAVKADYTDVHTGKFDNHPGQVLEMPRNKVDENPNSHCSNGFHVGNWRYCHSFCPSGGIMLEVEVNPADVVSVPNDLNEKIRVCKYKVLGVVDRKHSDADVLRTSKDDTKKVESELNEVCDFCGAEFEEDDEADSCFECGEPRYNFCEECGSECCYDLACQQNECLECGEPIDEEEEYCYDCGPDESQK